MKYMADSEDRTNVYESDKTICLTRFGGLSFRTNTSHDKRVSTCGQVRPALVLRLLLSYRTTYCTENGLRLKRTLHLTGLVYYKNHWICLEVP